MKRWVSVGLIAIVSMKESSAQTEVFVRDAVILKNGKSFVGQIVPTNDDSVRIKLDDGTTLAFHKKEVTARTKENVLPGYTPLSEQTEVKFVVAPNLGIGFNQLYGLAFGGWVSLTFSDRFFLGVSVSWYNGNSREFSFTVTEIVSYDPSGMSPTEFRYIPTRVREKTSAQTLYLTAGKELSSRLFRVLPYVGFGIARLRSDLAYLSGITPGQAAYLESDVPLDGSKILGFIAMGSIFVIPISDNWSLQPEARYNGSVIGFGGQIEGRSRPLTFVEGNNSGLSIHLSCGVSLY